ncbi:hypothetical protein [Streptomyces turgidiscabies]|uniref:Uncharacterized protein n=1 Tax=Streptomyces turgidiscabies TaxID=85558 RepID=A0ABU0RZ67_9ACTN|nr:hypothetical protein [Streptomyces turgidiscabies]MDQ0937283.1 hypothetical protein [Streptomyces turgidiscabies]
MRIGPFFQRFRLAEADPMSTTRAQPGGESGTWSPPTTSLPLAGPKIL